MFNRAQIIDRNFVRFLAEWDADVSPSDPHSPLSESGSLTGDDLLQLCESQMTARHLDLVARELRAKNQSFYTIGSAGHEGNAAVGRVTRCTDPAFLHYRSAAFIAERSRKTPNQDFIRDTLLSQVASIEDPIAGGRHKVWGSKALWIPPQTSTIASHLPKAVGTAFAIPRAKRIGKDLEIPADSIVVCSFGDASTHHSTAQGAFNAAFYASFQHLPCPILFVCEDNGIGISVHTATGWIEAKYGKRAGLKYFKADGLNVLDAYEAARHALNYCRAHRSPVFLHLQVVRLLGHAGTDMEPEYHTIPQIEAAEARDPVLATARMVLENGLCTAKQLSKVYEDIRSRVNAAAEFAISRPKQTSFTEVVAPLAPYDSRAVETEARRTADPERRAVAFGGPEKLPEKGPPRHMAVQINRALHDLMSKYDDLVVFGEDVAKKGGVYNITAGLLRQFGARRVFNTLLDEQTILGFAQGFGMMGLLPFPEIQYLAYFHNACDQIRGEACSTQFFSQDQFRTPMVLRIASFAYQKGFGGHFHNDNSIAALHDIPGLIIAVPSRGDDAAEMLRTCTALAKVNGRVVTFLEPIALYMTRDLYEDRDGKWQTDYPTPDRFAPLGEGRVYHPDATDLCIITYGNGVYLSLRAARTLRDKHKIAARILDLRWISPLNIEFIAKHARQCTHVLVVDEGRRTGGMAESIVTALVESCDPLPPLARVTGEDTYIPLGPAARLVLPSEEGIAERALQLCQS